MALGDSADDVIARSAPSGRHVSMPHGRTEVGYLDLELQLAEVAMSLRQPGRLVWRHEWHTERNATMLLQTQASRRCCICCSSSFPQTWLFVAAEANDRLRVDRHWPGN